MKVCYFGTFEKNYPRNYNIIKGLKKNNIELLELHEPVFDKIENKINTKTSVKIKIFFNLLKAYTKLIKRRKEAALSNIIIVGYIGQLDIFLAKILFPSKIIIFNPMISLYDTMIEDRKISSNIIIKKIFFYIDKISCKLADLVILDTPEYADYFHQTFNVPTKKLSFVPIGADEDVFFPPIKPTRNIEFQVLFYGKFSPLQGIEYILYAIKILKEHKDIKFTIIGRGQTYDKMRELSKNLGIDDKIEYIDWIPFEKLLKKIHSADIVLGGHFGKSAKATRVVSNKTFQIIASGKPVIISDSPASISAGFIHRQNAILCKLGDAENLAQSILELKNDRNLCDNIANEGYKLFKQKYSTQKIGEKMKEIIIQQTDNKEIWNDSLSYRLRKKIVFEYLIKSLPKNMFFLDIGLGGGNLCLDLAKAGFKGEGIDISDEAIRIAKLKLKNYNNQVFIHNQDLFTKTETEKYDLISAFEVLEHIENDTAAIKKIYSLLKKGGYLILSVPAHQKKFSDLDKWAGHFRRYEKNNLKKLITENNFNINIFYSYGFPLVNILQFIQKKILKQNSISENKEENTKQSGIQRNSGKKFKFLFNNIIIWPFYQLQKLFLHTDLSTGYIIIAKKYE